MCIKTHWGENNLNANVIEKKNGKNYAYASMDTGISTISHYKKKNDHEPAHKNKGHHLLQSQAHWRWALVSLHRPHYHQSQYSA